MSRENSIGALFARFFTIIIYLLGIGVVVPIVAGILSGVSPGITVSFLLSAFALQAITATLGPVFGLTVFQTLIILAFFAIGVILAVFEICRILGASSKRVASFIDKLAKKTEKYPMIRRYGSIMCFLIVWIPGIGLYGTPVIAWMLSWKRLPSIVFTFAGFMSGTLFFLFFASKINEALYIAAIAGILIYIVCQMLSAGFSMKTSRVLDSVRSPLPAIPFLFANIVLVPLAAWLIASWFKLPPGEAAGLVLLSLAAGAPLVFGFIERGGGTMGRISPLMIVLLIVSVAIIPLFFPVLVPVAGMTATVAAAFMVLLFLVPLVAGLIVRSRDEKMPVKWAPRLEKISWAGLAIVVIALLSFFGEAFLTLPGTNGILAAIAFIVVSGVLGYIAGGRDPLVRHASAQATVQRNLAAALVLSLIAFTDRTVMAMVLITGLLAMVPMFFFIYAIWKKKKTATANPVQES